MTFWHGGGRIDGSTVLPPESSGVSRSDDTGVFVTTDRRLAETYASSVNGAAWIYEVEPLGPLEETPSQIGGPTISYRCASARIVRRYTISKALRQRLVRSIERAAAELERIEAGR